MKPIYDSIWGTDTSRRTAGLASNMHGCFSGIKAQAEQRFTSSRSLQSYLSTEGDIGSFAMQHAHLLREKGTACHLLLLRQCCPIKLQCQARLSLKRRTKVILFCPWHNHLLAVFLSKDFASDALLIELCLSVTIRIIEKSKIVLWSRFKCLVTTSFPALPNAVVQITQLANKATRWLGHLKCYAHPADLPRTRIGVGRQQANMRASVQFAEPDHRAQKFPEKGINYLLPRSCSSS